jgi:glycosyl transferase family 2
MIVVETQRSLLVIAAAFCVSMALMARSSEFTTILLSFIKLAQSLELTRFDTPSFLRTQIELIQNLSPQNEFMQSLSANVLTKSNSWPGELRPRSFLFGRFKLIFLVAATDISVIIPTWNEERYLPKCLSSLRNQSLKGNHEIIVVDGGSTDRTLDVARRFSDKVLVEPRKPVGAARNAGAREAKGAILAFIDADTVASKEWLEEIVNSLGANPSAVCVTGPTIPYEGSRLDALMYHVATGWAQRLSFKLGFPHVAGFNCAYKKESFWEAGGFDESRELSEDVLLSLRIKHQGSILFSHDMIAYTSLRRINEYGYAYLTTYYTINAITVLLFRRTMAYPKVR